MKTKLLLCSFFLSTLVIAQEENVVNEIKSDTEFYGLESDSNIDTGFVPFQGDVKLNHSSYRYSTMSHSVNPHMQSCISLLRQQQGMTDAESAIRKNATQQTKTGAIAGTAMGAAAGVGFGLATGNPVIGAGVASGMWLFTALGTEIEKGKIRRNGNTASAAEKILAGQQLSKKERKAFEKTRKKVSKDAYKNKEALSDLSFAKVVNEQSGLGEKLFCDVDKHGNIRVLAQNKNTIKRLSLAARCEDEKKGRTIARRGSKRVLVK